MKKGLLSFLLAALTLVGCQNYDDQFDELNAKILALQSELTSISAIQSAITDLNTKIAAVQSSALTAADLAGIISDLDAVQAAVANLGSVGTEVENLNAEVDEILAALDDLLAANAVINQDLRITSDAELRYVASLVNLDPTPTVIVNGYVEVDATFAATNTSKIDSISAITNKINTILGNSSSKGLVASSANLTFNELSFLDANLEVTASGVGLPKLVTVGGDIDLNYAGAYNFPLISRAGTITLASSATKGTSVNFEGLTTATVIRSSAGVFSMPGATSVKLGSISLPASVTLAVCEEFTTLQSDSAGQAAFSASIGGSVTATTVNVDMSKMKKFTGTVTIVTGGTSPSTTNLGAVASAGQLNITSAGSVHLDALAGIHGATDIDANTVNLDAVTSTTALLTLVLPANSTVSLPALTTNAATITAATAKVFSAKELTVAQGIVSMGGATAEIEVKDVADLTRLLPSKQLSIHSQDSDLNFNSFGVTLTTLVINGKEKTGDTANQDNDITITASNTMLTSLSITDAASMFSSLTVTGNSGLVTITTLGSIRDFTVQDDAGVKGIIFQHSHIQGNGSPAATITVSNTGVTALDMSSMRKVKHISITGNSALASISAPEPAATDGEENFAETSALVTVTIQDNATTATYSRAVTGTDVTDYGYAYFSAGAAWIKSFKDWFDMFTGDAANANGANNKRTATGGANTANHIQNLTFDIEVDVVTMDGATSDIATVFAADTAGAAGATGAATDNQNDGGNITTYNELALSTATVSSIGY